MLALLSTKLTVAATSALGGAVLLSRQTVHAEELPASPAVQSRRQLSIYPSPSPTPSLVPVTAPLQLEVSRAREACESAFATARQHVLQGTQTWINWEGEFGQGVESFVPTTELRSPALLYVGVATLAGSILGRNRNILARFALPTSFCVLSIAYFLPQTWSNIEGRAAVVESQQFPALRDAREKARSLIAQARGRP